MIIELVTAAAFVFIGEILLVQSDEHKIPSVCRIFVLCSSGKVLYKY